MGWRSSRTEQHGVERANCLGQAGLGNDVEILTGSQLFGGNPTGGFGALDLVSFGAADNHKPSNVAVARNGVVISDYPAVHGIDPGFVLGAQRAGKATGLRMHLEGHDSTGAQDWIDTYAATGLTNSQAAFPGFDPVFVGYALGGQDGLTAATAAAADMKLRRLRSIVRATRPRAVFVVCGIMSTDTTSFPALAALKAVGRSVFSDRLDDRQAYFDPDDFQGYLQTDNTHLVSFGQVLLGLEFYRRFLQSGAPGAV